MVPGPDSLPNLARSPLDQPLGTAGLAGLTASIAAKLEKGLGVVTIRDLLETVPRRYLDLSRQAPIRDLRPGMEATIQGKVLNVTGRRFGGSRHLLTVKLGDQTGYLELIWWNQPFRERQFTTGSLLVAAGRVDFNRNKLQIVNPFVETMAASGVHTGRIIPVHPATAGVSATQIRRFVHEALQRYGSHVDEPLGEQLRRERGYPPRREALTQIHFPSDEATRQKARHRLAFEELYVLSTSLALAKRHHQTELQALPLTSGEDEVAAFLSHLPFQPTGAQKRAISQISSDLAGTAPMNRLLQGDVGAGKTLVALAAAVRAAANGAQAAIMAPTEVLAEQHARSMTAMLEPMQSFGAADGKLFGSTYSLALLTGSTPAAERRRVLAGVADGSIQILVGTHALIQEGVDFKQLALAVVDEQHRFGVHQRVALRDKGDGKRPHTLVMTATPIPRTLALTVYGDLEVSVLDELPPGRAPVVTSIVQSDAQRREAFELLKAEVAAGHQGFVVCPLVEDSETLEAKAAEAVFQQLSEVELSDLRLGLMHGRLKAADKEATMTKLRAGELDVLVATTVVEVGVDLPLATVLLIEDADRFGLSQLHQLRGRVGRSNLPAWCFLATRADLDAPEREATKQRLEAMVRTRDGFELAELDLKLRGTGQLFGATQTEDSSGAPAQTGRSDLVFTNLLRDQNLLTEARAAAFAAVDEDPALASNEHAGLKRELKRRFADRIDWLFAS